MEIHCKKMKYIEYINEKAYALNNIDEEKLDENSEFPIGSITKVFTIISLLILQQKKKLNIEDKLEIYFNDTFFIPELANIKIIDIINHVSGLKNMFDAYNYEGTEKKFNSSSDAFFYFYNKDEKLLMHNEYEYSNLGYILLGVLIENITKKPYKKIVKKLILKKLEMNNTGFGKTNIILYDNNGEKLTKKLKNERNFASSGGQLKSSLCDFIKFSNFPMLLNENSKKILKKIYFCTEQKDEIIVEHSGSIHGGKANIKIKYTLNWNVKKISMFLQTGK